MGVPRGGATSADESVSAEEGELAIRPVEKDKSLSSDEPLEEEAASMPSTVIGGPTKATRSRNNMIPDEEDPPFMQVERKKGKNKGKEVDYRPQGQKRTVGGQKDIVSV